VTIPLWTGVTTTGDGHSHGHRWGRNAEFCVTVIVPILLAYWSSQLKTLLLFAEVANGGPTEVVCMMYYRLPAQRSAKGGNRPNCFSCEILSCYPHRLCRPAWVGFSSPSVCLYVCPQHNSKTNDPKVFKLNWYGECSWDILQVTWFRVKRSKVKVMVRVNSNAVWVRTL